MLTPDYPRLPLRGLAAATVMAALMLLPASATLAMDAGSADLELTLVDPAGVQATVGELRTMVDALSLANDALQVDNTTLHQTVDAITAERDRLRSSLDSFDDLYAPLEADRQLLFELRKSMPETRPEAEAQLERIRALALSADPARLGQLLDRVTEAAPAYLDWRFGEFDTGQDFTAAYIDTGANAFDTSMEEFRSEVLRSVATQLDGLLTVLDRVR